MKPPPLDGGNVDIKLVTVDLDKPRHLKMTLGAMIAYEQASGKSLLKGFNLKDMNLTEVATLFWACLLHEDRELPYDAFVWEIMDIGTMSKLSMMKAIADCVNESASEKPGPFVEGSPPSG